MDPMVRWADAQDAREVATVHVDSWRAAYRGLIEQHVLDALDVDQRAMRWSEWIGHSVANRDDRHRMLVAESSGQVVGWATFGPGRDEGMERVGELAALYVHPDYWSARIGHALITRVEEELVAEGRAQAYLWVLRGNDRASHFYERHGWVPDGAQKVGQAGGAVDLEENRHWRDLDPGVVSR
jgi:GNAT superfamily N-acetyltransferase